ncbi:MAG: hypothetical protein ACLQVD_02000 [Capsulimonadaceae bacterium]
MAGVCPTVLYRVRQRLKRFKALKRNFRLTVLNLLKKTILGTVLKVPRDSVDVFAALKIQLFSVLKPEPSLYRQVHLVDKAANGAPRIPVGWSDECLRIPRDNCFSVTFCLGHGSVRRAILLMRSPSHAMVLTEIRNSFSVFSLAENS